MKKLRVIFVHGISDAVMTNAYSAGLTELLTEELTKVGLLPPKAKPEDISKVITFDTYNYSEVSQSDEEEVYKLYKQETAGLYNFADKLLENLLLGDVRRQIITSVNDALVYLSDYGSKKIRSGLAAMIEQSLDTGDAVTVVGHSLGSVVAFDTVYYNSNKKWATYNFLPANLITMGSPIALFSTVPDDDGQPKWRYDPKQVNTSPIRLVHEQGVWYNFLDAQDLIGYPLNLLYKEKYVVEDILVQTGTLPLQAHTDYWKDHEVARIITERLRLDYERING